MPSAIHLGHLLLPVSALASAIAIVAALLLSQRTAARAGISPDALWTAGIFAVVAAFIASRLLLIAADPGAFLHQPLLVLALPSLTALGVLLSVVATLLYLRRRHIALRSALDAWAAPGALLWSVLALGDFAQRSDPGLPTRLPWAVRSSATGAAEHPVALYAALFALALTLSLLRAQSSPRFAETGTLAAVTLLAGGIAQFLLSFLREPLLAIYTPTPLVEPLQWTALAAAAAGALLLLTHRAPSPQRATHPQPLSPSRSHAL